MSTGDPGVEGAMAPPEAPIEGRETAGRATSTTTPRCGAKARHGGPCGQSAGYGTDHVGFGRCKHHGGAHRNGRAHAARQAAAVEAARMGATAPIDAHQALEIVLGTVHAGTEFLRQRVLELKDVDVLDAESGRLHPTAQAFLGELDRLARVAKTATDAGVDERRLQLDEQRADLVAALLRAVVDDLDLSPEQRERLPEIMRQRLPVINGTARPTLEAA